MKNHSRRQFIRGMALTGLGATIFSPLESRGHDMGNHTGWSHPLLQNPTLPEGKLILFQGDSITDGNRGRDEDPNHIMGHGYAFSIASRWGAAYPEKGFRFINKGISGNRIIDLAERWQQDTLDLKPDVLSILVGVNDSSSVVYNREPVVSVEQYEKQYQSLLKKTREELPDLVFVLCQPFILPVGKVKENWATYQPDLARRQEVVENLALQYDAVFIGLQEVFDLACEKAPAEYWMWDGVHPTVAGHELVAREWIKQVGQRLSL